MAQVEITAGTRRRNRFGAFIRDSKGATAVEFALIAVPFLALLAGLIQTFLILFAQSVLENTVRASARQILTGQTQTADASLSPAAAMAAFHQTVCNNANVLFSCTGLMVEVQVADVPGRFEPGIGEINYPAIAAALHEAGFTGVVGLEAWASGDSHTALDRFKATFTAG